MRQALMTGFTAGETASCYRIGHIEEDLSRAISQGKKLIVGHIDFGHLSDVALPDDYQLLVMFRRPVDRVISTYLHFQKHDNPRYTTWKEGQVDFDAFLETEFAHNWLCQLLAGSKGLMASADEKEAVFSAAENNLKKLSWVGISERFEDSLFSLSVFVGRRLKYPGRFNVNHEPDQHQALKEKYERQLLVQNELDIRIHQQAERRLHDQLNQIRFRRIRRAWFNWTSGVNNVSA